MSSWLRNNGALRGAPPAPAAPPRCDPDVRYETFRKHWQQTDVIVADSNRQRGAAASHDDVLAVVGHLDHLVTLLLLEMRSSPEGGDGGNGGEEGLGGGACLSLLLSERALEKLRAWGERAGRYRDAVRVEQLKLYSLLVGHGGGGGGGGGGLLCAEPFLRPLLELLGSFRAELLAEDVEGRLVCLLGQLCMVLMHNVQFVDFFFVPPPMTTHHNSSFLPVSLLMSFVHREGSLGQQARAALLLCAALSAKNRAVADFICDRSNVCPLLATGLSGLYSLLPRNIDVAQGDWHRLTPDDVNDINKLGLFINSLEFCNAVAQVSHPSIRSQLLDYFYQGFLLPVMGPALLQKKRGQASTTRPQPPYLQSGVDEQVAAIAYLELSLRTVGEPGLLKSLVRFLLDKNYDGSNILDTVIPLINGEPRVAIVTISLMETLVDLNCEDLMIELVFKYLINGNHLMVSHRQKSLDLDIHCRATDMFLSLSPECCAHRPPEVPASRRNSTVGGSRKVSITSLDQNMSSLSSISEQGIALTPIGSPPTPVAYGLNANESLYGNYHAYLCEARRKILSCKKSCANWSLSYDRYCTDGVQKHLNVDDGFNLDNSNATTKEGDSLQSIGESSGYESFKYRGEDVNPIVDGESNVYETEYKEFAEELFWKTDRLLHEPLQKQTSKDGTPPAQLEEIDIGPLLKHSLEKLGKMLNNNVYVNLRLTSLISRLATYPMPILRSFLLSPWIVLQPVITSLYQILVSVKQQIDESVLNESERNRLLEEAQAFLIDREIRLANTRKNAIESIGAKAQSSDKTGGTPQFGSQNNSDPQSNSFNSDQSPIIQTMAAYEPFRRNEPKRRSLSSSLTSMFTRKSAAITAPPSTPSALDPDSTTPRTSEQIMPYSSLAEDNLWHSTASRRVLLNALVLDEWLKELGALAQEHLVCSVSEQLDREKPRTAPEENKAL